MIIYDRTKDNLEEIKLTKGTYTFIYPISDKNYDFSDLSTKKYPIIQTVYNKQVLITKAYVQGDQFYMMVDVPENPIPVIALIWIVGTVIVAFSLTKVLQPLEKIVKETVSVFSPTKLILIVLAIGIIVIVPRVFPKANLLTKLKTGV